jgi:phosphate starvation-inducible PhoH-like protein
LDADSLVFDLVDHDTDRLARVCGPLDAHLSQIEKRLEIEINRRGIRFELKGETGRIAQAQSLIQALMADVDCEITPEEVHLQLNDTLQAVEQNAAVTIMTRKAVIRPRGRHQREYVQSIATHDLVFGIGPAGTGKTWLAVACAVQALESERVKRLVLVRPAVEAGERLGFLPGDLAQKVDPYLRPIYDALYEMLGFDRVARLMERNVIEVAPLAYMRGRTLNHAFIILDEAQNTTRQQMKMFLTRMGFGSTAVITGDITQVDLPQREASGLADAVKLLNGVEGVSFNWFTAEDVVRHPLVQRVILAYEAHENG